MKLLPNSGGYRSACAAIRIIWLGALTIAAAGAHAASVTVNAAAPIIEISGSNPGRLSEVGPGTLMNFSYTYPSDLALTRHHEESWLYDAPVGATLSTLQAGTLYREFSKLQLQLFEGVQNNFNPRPQTVDMAWLFAFDPQEPIDSISAILLFEEGSFIGGPVLPSTGPFMTYLEFTDYGNTVGDYAKARGPIPMSPVPEASTFGLMGVLGLGILVAVRRIRVAKHDKAAAAMAA